MLAHMHVAGEPRFLRKVFAGSSFCNKIYCTTHPFTLGQPLTCLFSSKCERPEKRVSHSSCCKHALYLNSLPHESSTISGAPKALQD